MEKQLVIKVDHVSMKFNLASEKFDSFLKQESRNCYFPII